MSARRSTQSPDATNRRQRELSGHIREAENLIREYEEKLRRSSDPKEKTDCRTKIAEQNRLLTGYQREYARLTEGSSAPAGRQKAANAFPPEWITRLPHPIATACADFNQAEDTTARFLALDSLLLAFVKYLAAIALAQYRQEQPDSAQLRPWLDRLSRRNLRDWQVLLDEIAGHYEAQTAPSSGLVTVLFDPYNRLLTADAPLAKLAAELGTRLDDASTGPLAVSWALERLVRYRDYTWGSGPAYLTAPFKRKLLPLLQPALQELLTTFSFIQDYQLRYAEVVHDTADGWRYDMLDWRGLAETPPYGKPLLAPASPQPPYKGRRLYLCTPKGKPLVNLHPLLVHYQGHLWFLENFAEDEQLAFRPCHGGAIVNVPMAHVASLATIVRESQKEADAGLQLDNIEAGIDQADEVPDESQPVEPLQDPPPASEPPSPSGLRELLAKLDDDARQALQIALGESLRIGHFWLGLEFLLMGLSKQEEGTLPALLAEIGLDPGELRAALRGLAGVRPETEKTWRHANVKTVGTEAWDQLQVIDPATLAADVTAGKTPQAAITPRMLAVLRAAVQLAGEGMAGPDHLLLAALQHPQSLAINMLLSQVAEAGQDPRQWLAELQAQVVGGAASPPNGEPQHPKVNEDGGPARAAQPAAPRAARGKGLLGALGRDLTALAQAQPPQLHPAIGEAARKAMGQMGQILLQAQGNNPILLGDPGVGKTAIVEGFAWRLANDQKVVAQLAARRIIDLPPTALLAGTKYRGDLEQRLQQVLAEVHAANGQTIIFIDEIHTILGGKAEGGLGAIADALKPALSRGEFPCIGATTVAEYRRYIESDPALARRFTPVWIEEPSQDDAVKIANTVAQEQLAPRHSVTYPDEAAREAVRLAVRYLHDEFLPGKAIKLLDQAGPRVIMGGSLSGPKSAGTTVGSGEVTVETLRAIVAERTGIPVTRLGEDDRARLRALEERLKARVKGQDQAVQAVVAAVKRARTGLGDPNRPQGVLLFAGPTGVGKTELALALAEALFDDENAIVRLDMSEYLEKHQVSRLIGSPPGYIGHEEEGQLTGRLRRRPYSVVLLDEIEKAHPDVQHLFLQLFDAGRLTDSRGRLADGRHAIFIMTTNLGTRDAMGFTHEPPTYEAKLKKAVEDHFTPEFRNRIQRTIYFRPLDQAMLMVIFDKLFARTAARFSAQGIVVKVDDALKDALCQQAVSSKEGARPLERAIEDEIVAPLVDGLLDGKIARDQHVVIGPNKTLIVSEIPKAPAAAQPEGAPAAQPPAKPKQKDSPDARLPEEPQPNQERLDPREVHNRAALAPRLAALNGQLHDRQIALTLTEGVIELLCSPFWQNERRGLSTGQAFVELVEKPLLERVQAGVFREGHRVEAYRDLALAIAFRKVESDQT